MVAYPAPFVVGYRVDHDLLEALETWNRREGIASPLARNMLHEIAVTGMAYVEWYDVAQSFMGEEDNPEEWPEETIDHWQDAGFPHPAPWNLPQKWQDTIDAARQDDPEWTE